MGTAKREMGQRLLRSDCVSPELAEEKGLRLGRLEPRDGTVEVTTDGDTT
jgi:hypothetical protein